MSNEVLTFLIIIMLPRICYLFLEADNITRIYTASLLQLGLLLFIYVWNPAILFSAVLIIALGLLAIVIQKKNRPGEYGARQIASLLTLIIIPLYLSSYWELAYSEVFLGLSTHLQSRLPFFQGLGAESIYLNHLCITGLLLLANETNIFIRAVIHSHNLEPPVEQAGNDKEIGTVDKKEYNAGRIIGILERWLMFLIILFTNQLSAIAIVIAAKGFARMKQMDDKIFAEYVLVGTLLSTLSAVVTGFWLKGYL